MNSARGAPTETQYTDRHTFNPITDTSQPVPINPFRNPSIRYAVAHMCRAILSSSRKSCTRARYRVIFIFLFLIFTLGFFNIICISFAPPPHENDRVLRISKKTTNKYIYIFGFVFLFQFSLHYIYFVLLIAHLKCFVFSTFKQKTPRKVVCH